MNWKIRRFIVRCDIQAQQQRIPQILDDTKRLIEYVTQGGCTAKIFFSAILMAESKESQEQFLQLIANSHLFHQIIIAIHEEFIITLGNLQRTQQLEPHLYILADTLLMLSYSTNICLPQAYHAICTSILSMLPLLRHKQLQLNLMSTIGNLAANGTHFVELGQLFSVCARLLRFNCSNEMVKQIVRVTLLASENRLDTQPHAVKEQINQFAGLLLGYLNNNITIRQIELIRHSYKLLTRLGSVITPQHAAGYMDLYLGLGYPPRQQLSQFAINYYTPAARDRSQQIGKRLAKRVIQQFNLLAEDSDKDQAILSELCEWLATYL